MFVHKHTFFLFLIAIICIGAFLRFYNFTNLLRFNNDQVRDMKTVTAMISAHEFPLLGPKAGGTSFRLGPTFYYMEYASALVFGDSPQGVAFFVPILGTLSIILFYLLISKCYSSITTLSLTFLYATSFYIIKYSRFAWNPNVIPFFLFAFFLILLKIISFDTKKNYWWFCGLGIISGISMQLHTTLLILIPIFITLAFIYSYTKTKKIPFLGISITCIFIAINLLPMALYDVMNNGENVIAFFHGSESKGALRESVFHNILLDGQLFVQSTTYVLTGIEHTKNWTDAKKLILMHNFKEIFFALISIFLFLYGLYLFIIRTKLSRQSTVKSDLHLILLTASLICFVLYIPIAHELNTRFFIIIIFLPFIFLGSFFDMLLQHTKIPRKFSIVIITLCTCALFGSNIKMYASAYNLNNTEIDTSIYGGISMQELQSIISYMDKKTKESNTEMIYLLPNTFGQSFRSVAQDAEIPLTTYPAGKISTDSLAFFLSDKPNKTILSKDLQPCFDLIESQKIYRFRVFALQKTSSECK